MRIRVPIFLAAATLLCAAAASATTFVRTERYAKEFPINADGAVWIDNRFGTIEVTGSDSPNVSIVADIAIQAVDDAAYKEGHEQTRISVAAAPHLIVVKTVLPMVRTARWMSAVSYTVRVPRTVGIKVASQYADRIHIAGTGAPVSVNNF